MPENIGLFYNIMEDIHFLVMQLITAICLLILCRDFLKKRSGTGLIGTAYFLVCTGLYYLPFVIENFVAYFFALAAAFLVFVLLDRRNIKMKIFLMATFFVIRWIAFSLTGKITQLLSEAVTEIMNRRLDLSNPSMWKYSFCETGIMSIVDLGLSGLFLWVMVKEISKVFLYKQREMGLKELLVLMIPSVNGMVCYEIFQSYANILEKKTGTSVFLSYPGLNLLWIIAHLITLLAIVSTIVLYQNIKKNQDRENARLILESEIRDMQSHITEVEKLYTEIRGVKHDIKNHVNVMSSLLEQGKVEEVRSYLNPLQQTVENFDFPIKTGNPVTDVIIHEKMEEARIREIKFTADFHYPQDGKINAFDVSVILSNALSNAIEAAKAGGFVRVSSFRNKNAYLITVENSYEGSFILDEDSGLPKTKKENKKVHGFGIQNMKSVAAKYYGDVLIECRNNAVILTVMLLISDND